MAAAGNCPDDLLESTDHPGVAAWGISGTTCCVVSSPTGDQLTAIVCGNEFLNVTQRRNDRTALVLPGSLAGDDPLGSTFSAADAFGPKVSTLAK